jgi:hypothetical protein
MAEKQAMCQVGRCQQPCAAADHGYGWVEKKEGHSAWVGGVAGVGTNEL